MGQLVVGIFFAQGQQGFGHGKIFGRGEFDVLPLAVAETDRVAGGFDDRCVVGEAGAEIGPVGVAQQVGPEELRSLYDPQAAAVDDA